MATNSPAWEQGLFDTLLFLALFVGVVALAMALRSRQWGWSALLLVAALCGAFGPHLAFLVIPYLAFARHAPDQLVFGVGEAVPPLAARFYGFSSVSPPAHGRPR